MPSKINSAQERIAAFSKFGSKLGLERMEALLNELGNPEEGLSVIHVAGTNGKGSVCRYVYEALSSLGYRVGLYTSPYVVCFNERMEANGGAVTDGELDELADAVIPVAERVARMAGDPVTEFEVITAMAFLWFRNLGLDFVVLEVGLGGRGDSTNVVRQPLVSVITEISFDHMDRLGETLAEIAAEKAGIIKPGCPVVSGATGAAARVIARKAYELGCALTDVNRVKRSLAPGMSARGGYSFSAVIDGARYDSFELSMPGAHQVSNAITALCVIDILRHEKLVVSDSAKLRAGIQKAVMPARFQIYSENPLVIFDGAHNVSGARTLADTLKELYPGKHIRFVTAILRDKQASEILAVFSEVASSYIFTSSSNPRSLSAEEVADIAVNSGAASIPAPKENKSSLQPATLPPFVTAPGAPLATDLAFALPPADVTVFAGSFYLIGDVIKYLNEKNTLDI
ncbi:MAG: bifunctional folylpolyglutamate synthase/dihydrofolate synthase [Clostridiales Family XIII bacterium]|jgi:dihydrofolate synthase/folylpolyglutamate synthase|nr:bifunctional folylpolyglutamate synthase/dihydrofolate synthase [Clostridiales Family XIII bacterium]